MGVESPIQQFYTGRTVLVTGGTGFMGKVLIEKLLRSTQIATVYLLIRPKKGKNVQERVTELFQDAIFSRLKDGCQRVVAVEGDVSTPGLGLGPSDEELIRRQVEIVFHGAATVRFDETLARAILTNVRGTREVLKLAQNCVNLKAFVHISTAYANCTQREIHEEFFEPPLTGDNAISLTECLSDSQLSDISTVLCGEYPNTYAFTKAIAENTVKVYGQGLPIVVFRPSIVVATAREPLQGWVDNVYGPTGVQCGVGAGVLRTFHVNKAYAADLVPVDMAINAIIASTWDLRNSDGMQVYNYVSSCQNPLVWDQFIEMGLRYGRQYPPIKAIWYITMTVSKFRMIYLVYQWLLHLLPALLVDSALTLTGRKPMLWPVYKKVHKFSTVITYFSMRQWTFHNDRVLTLWQKMAQKDRELFEFDISALDWDLFIKNTITGLRVHFFKDPPDTLPAAKRKQFCFFLAHNVLQILLVAAVFWIFWSLLLLIIPS